MAKRETIFKYAEKKYGAKPDYPWQQYPNYAVLRHDGSNKWYGLVMTVEKQKLGLKGEGSVDVLNLKMHPELIGALRQSKGFLPAYHMNKEHWLSVLLDGSVAMEEIYRLIDTSYELTQK